ncbi:hypothetical protein [Phaeocystidibacter luteus]|uniref:hypothetical protein n=1 Tax=Phaeocystidibacter luteus TaxID=911197 RepID=UPI0014792E86|nr:hypothetical protein [Phaeocystidibacter luteus]
MQTKATSLLERLGMRHADVEGPMCLWSPDNNKLITGYKRIKNRLRKTESP